MKRLNAVGKIIYMILFGLIFFTLLSTVLRKEMLGTCMMSVVFILLTIFFFYKSSLREDFSDGIYKYCLTGFLIGIGIFQISNIDKLRYIPSFDLDAIYGGAIQWVEQGSFSGYYDYFDWFPNNLGGLCFLFVLFSVGRFFTTDYFLIASLGNEMLLLLTFALISLSAKKVWGSRHGILALFLCGGMLPFLFMTPVFYTDSLSVLFPVLLFYLFLKIKESGKKSIWKWCIIYGIAASVGIFIKSTVLVMVLATGITLLLNKSWDRFLKYAVCFAVIFISMMFAVNTYIYGSHLDKEAAEVKNTPYYHWIMMGLEGEGEYNPGDYELTRSFDDPKERDERLKEEIRERVSQKGIAGMTKLYAAKIRRCFGDGTLGLSDFLDDNPQSSGVLQQFLLYGGNKYSIYQFVCNIFFYALLILSFICLSGEIIIGKREIPFYQKDWFPLMLALGGMIIFLMNWETSPRYITNYVPVIILLAIGGIQSMMNWIGEKNIDKTISYYVNKYAEEIKIFGTAVAFRIIIYLLSVCVMAIFGDFSSEITFNDFLEAWKRWDSAHYINIAENGYSGAVENGEHIFLVFYPLYPWLLKTVSVLIGDIRMCGILISTVSYAVGCVFFYKITEKELNSDTAKNALVLLSIFPFAFFFGSIATESLFFALSGAFFYYLRKHKWGKVAFLGFLSCMTKTQGLLLTFPVLAELFYFKRGICLIKKRDWKSLFKRIIYQGCIAATMLFGFLIYLLINYIVEGDFFRFMYYQKNHWGNSLCPIWETSAYVKNNAVSGWYTSTGMSLWVPEMLLFGIYIAAIVYGICRKLRPMYMTYLIAFFVLTYSSTWLISAGRYTVNALPLFMLFGDFTSKHEKYKIPVMILSAMVMMIYMVGYYQWKQIM